MNSHKIGCELFSDEETLLLTESLSFVREILIAHDIKFHLRYNAYTWSRLC